MIFSCDSGSYELFNADEEASIVVAAVHEVETVIELKLCPGGLGRCHTLHVLGQNTHPVTRRMAIAFRHATPGLPMGAKCGEGNLLRSLGPAFASWLRAPQRGLWGRVSQGAFGPDQWVASA